MALDLTAERVAANQSRFREANEHIELAAERVPLLAPVPFLCECPREDCTTIVPLPMEDYEEIRKHPRFFLTAPGHEGISVERGFGTVVSHADGYVVVEKIGEAGAISEENYRRLFE
jgi:hypothetical protein